MTCQKRMETRVTETDDLNILLSGVTSGCTLGRREFRSGVGD